MRSLLHVLLTLCLLGAAAAAPASEHGGAETEGGSTAASGFLDIKPALITNYGGPGAIHFLKIEITLRLSKDPQANVLVTHHMPVIRHTLIMLFSRQDEAALTSMEGKEKLRAEALDAVQKALDAEEHKKLVEDLLFTNFVIQR